MTTETPDVRPGQVWERPGGGSQFTVLQVVRVRHGITLGSPRAVVRSARTSEIRIDRFGSFRLIQDAEPVSADDVPRCPGCGSTLCPDCR